ncbi:Phloretin 2'-O-glucosyltransferase [Ananas comosus]|uniref:Phloretin 2'-O-glucosyltransferase n=1 Tax=Ananas comosus TaxID=4615 RepID=A0A199W1C5_ANACO|nr:Phloretin 2'-O-glucosyltransferase [Ananas comosus]
MKETVVLYSGMGVGHLTPMVELAELFVRRGFASVAVVAVESPFPGAPSLEPVISRLSSSHRASSISFHLLPRVPPPAGGNPVAQRFDVLRLNNPALLSLLRSLSPPPRALVLDFFCIDALDVAAELALPAYFFFSSGAAILAVFLHLPHDHDRAGAASFKDLGRAPVHFPGVRPIPAGDMHPALSDRDTDAYRALVRNFGRLPDSRGILVFLVDEIRVGVAVDGYDQVLVAADEVERKVRLVMETEDGQRLRARAAELKDKAAAALDVGGSSHAAFQQFLFKDLEKQQGGMEFDE